ncbi:IS66-like element accessory protein TnpA [Sinorhizobium meliloti]|uniref:IS66-like element accessory protein TnpA n=1 Tax=Rhizobium meliloti TaxID=382 RepID=UPI000FD93854|nr:transposase [Sinorhizobium meliloti]RVK06509.1 transposase [Sinorhizobium meliloti]
MVGDRAGAMLGVMDEAMDEARHDGAYRRNWTDEEKARILAESAEPGVNISAVARRWGVNRGLLTVWRREAGLTSRRSEQACAQQAMFVPVTVVGERTLHQSASSDIASGASGRIEIEIAGARLTVIGSVAPELAQAVVAALRGRR